MVATRISGTARRGACVVGSAGCCNVCCWLLGFGRLSYACFGGGLIDTSVAVCDSSRHCCFESCTVFFGSGEVERRREDSKVLFDGDDDDDGKCVVAFVGWLVVGCVRMLWWSKRSKDSSAPATRFEIRNLRKRFRSSSSACSHHQQEAAGAAELSIGTSTSKDCVAKTQQSELGKDCTLPASNQMQLLASSLFAFVVALSSHTKRERMAFSSSSAPSDNALFAAFGSSSSDEEQPPSADVTPSRRRRVRDVQNGVLAFHEGTERALLLHVQQQLQRQQPPENTQISRAAASVAAAYCNWSTTFACRGTG